MGEADRTVTEVIVNYVEKFYKNEAKAFVNEHPDYIACPENKNLLFDRLREKQLMLTSETLSAVYDELKEEGKLQLRMAMPYDG